MRLYLIRHATAADAERFAGPDEDRPLTHRGRVELRAVLPQVAAEEAPPRMIWTSPLVRAVQTAEAVLSLWAPGAELRVTRSLLSGADPAEVLEELHHEAVVSPLALVGHEPHLGQLFMRLINQPQDLFSMPKAAVLRLRFRTGESPLGAFRALYEPGGKPPTTDLRDLVGD